MTVPLSKLKIPKHKNVWEGPSSNGPNGGISQSMLAKFLQCREEFRIKYVLGLKPNEGFSHLLEYGNMWHLCEENMAKEPPGTKVSDRWQKPLKAYVTELQTKYKTAQKEITKWYNCCLYQFPIYVNFWKKHPDTKGRTGLLQEEVFKIPYKLPSGRIVYLRGKFDGVDLIKDKKGSGIYLFETKTKGEVDPGALTQQLNFDMQTMMYLVTLEKALKDADRYFGSHMVRYADLPVKGVRYNVIRRPLSGGKGSIKQKKIKGTMETTEAFYTRLQQYFIEDPEYWFIRFKVEVSQEDIENFKIQFLNPILEQLCDWWEYIGVQVPEIHGNDIWQCKSQSIHYRHPFGVRNMIDERGRSDYQEYMATGNTIGLQRVTKLFGELQ